MRSIPILFTPLPVNAPLKHKLTPDIQRKADSKHLPSASATNKSPKIEMAIDHLPPSLQKLCDENPAFAHALKVDLAGISKTAYDHESDSDSDDDEYESEGLRFKRYMDKMRGIELGREDYHFAMDKDEDEESQDGDNQDSGYLPTIWKENGEVMFAPPNDEVGEEALGDVSAAYRVRIKEKSPVSLKDKDQPVLADQKLDWSIDWEKDFIFTFKFDQDVPIDTPDLSTGDLSCSLADTPPLNTPHGSPCISRTKTLYNIHDAGIEDKDDNNEAARRPDDTPICPLTKGATRPPVEPSMIPFDPRRSKYTAYSTLVRPREVDHDINTIYEESLSNTPTGHTVLDNRFGDPAINHIAQSYASLMDSYAANCDDVFCKLPTHQGFKWEKSVKPASLPTESGVQILRDGQPIYLAKQPDSSFRAAKQVANPILKQSGTDMVKVNRPAVRFNPDLEYSATPPPIEQIGRYRPVTYRGQHARYYQAAMRTTPVVPEPIGAPLINIMLDTLTPVACNIAKSIQIGFKATVQSVSGAMEGLIPHHPGIERAGRGVDGRRMARIHKGLNS